MPPKKRKRPTTSPKKSPAKAKGGENRPKPPPPAPPALIRLLKKDKKVLEYFKALQVNLSYDVDKWKKRSQAYKDELEELRRAQRQKELLLEEEQEQNKKQKGDGTQGSPSKSLASQKKAKAAAPVATNEETQIHDSAFDFELSSSSDDDDDVNNNGFDSKPLHSSAAGKETSRGSYKFSIDDDDDDNNNDDEQGMDDNGNDAGVTTKNDENNQGNIENHDGQGRANGSKNVSSTAKPYPSHSDNWEGEKVSEEGMTMECSSSNNPIKSQPIPKRIRVGWEYLRKADEYLNEIGIFLATTLVIDDDKNDDADSFKNGNVEIDESDQKEGRNSIENHNGHDHSTANADVTVEGEAEEKEPRTYTSYIRRSDNSVLEDIVETIKNWTKLKVTATFPLRNSESLCGENAEVETTENDSNQRSTTFEHQYAAFVTRDFIPCFVSVPQHTLAESECHQVGVGDVDEKMKLFTVPQHPAVRGVEILLKALAWIDAFGPVLDEVEIDDEFGFSRSESYFAQLARLEVDEHDVQANQASSVADGLFLSAKLFVTGMKKRHSMVKNFVKSLEGEICEAWPVQDRFNRVGKTYLHFTMKDSNGNANDNSHLEALEDVAMGQKQRRTLAFDSRLTGMVDRCILTRIVTTIYLHRNDPSSAIDFLFRYLLRTVPSLQQEDYPKYPPVQSLLIIETILNTPFRLNIDRADTNERTLLDFLLDNILLPDQDCENKTESGKNNKVSSCFLFDSFQLVLEIPATIYSLRKIDEDTRISDPGLVEVAAYQRIVSLLSRSGDKLSKTRGGTKEVTEVENDCKVFTKRFLKEFTAGMEGNSQLMKNSKQTSTALAWIFPIILIGQGNGQELRHIFSERWEVFSSSRSETELLILEVCSKAMRQMEICNIDYYRATISLPTTTNVATITQSKMTQLVNSITTKTTDDDQSKISINLTSLSILLRMCHELADGENALRILQWWLNENISFEAQEASRFVDYWSTLPMVRVINLERRQDRMAAFMSQIMHAGLWAIRGVIPPDRWHTMKQYQNDENDLFCSEKDNIFASYIGTYAIDGSQDSPTHVESKLIEWLELGGATNGSLKRELDLLVKPQWRPNDLRAFDIHASDDPALIVPLSPSEKACALSHIATWKGIASSSFANRFTFTGFAYGDPIHEPAGKVGKRRMPPCPVALVLEDDAVLVDRFRDRLDQLLEELPRDFHYCALGYAKPKEAPLVDVPGCEHIKLPTMTWYLTGYLLSQPGAQYLLDHLPVVGPIDAWMGRKMILTSNWENDYGHRIGVGDAPIVGSDHVRPTVSVKEIRLCLKFRAYCAGVPLCDQKVRTTTSTGASASFHNKPAQNWRLRDSDIVYSGNVGTTTRKRDRYKNKFRI